MVKNWTCFISEDDTGLALDRSKATLLAEILILMRSSQCSRMELDLVHIDMTGEEFSQKLDDELDVGLEQGLGTRPYVFLDVFLA